MKREKEIDIAKGIGIIFVVIGHSYTSWNIITQLINSFHMPFFFIVSGILYRLQFDRNGCCVLKYKNKIKSLIVPWIIWGSCYQLFLSGLSVIGGESLIENAKNFFEQFMELGFGSMWFLPALFIASAMFLWTLRDKKLNMIVSIISIIVGLFAPQINGIINSLLRAILGCGFIGIGFYGFPLFYRKQVNLLTTISIVAIYIYFSLYNGVVAMYARKFGHPALFAITGILGSWILLRICKYLKRIDNSYILGIIKQYGEKSIVVLCLHNFLIEVIRLLDYRLFSDWLKTLGIAEGLVLTFTVLFIIKALFPICDRYLMRSFGYKLGVK